MRRRKYIEDRLPIITCTYNVTGTTSATRLCKYATGVTTMIVDGVTLDSPNTGYTFSTLGEHTVEFKLNNFRPYALFSGCTMLTTANIEKTCKSIGSLMFCNCINLASGLILPNSVASIGDDAFWNCTGLTSIVIPDSVISIGSSAFHSCRGLTSVEIGSGVTTIGSYAFDSCDGLTSVVIPDSVTTIGKQTFWNCTGLTSIVVDSNNTVYDSRENCNCIIKTATNTLIQGCNSSFIPDSVTSIGDSAFRDCRGLTGELVIPDSVTSIGDSAFYSCYGLTGELVIPDSVTSIGSSVFGSCRGLTGELVIPDSVTSIGDSAFYECSGLTSVTIGSGVTSIGSSAFTNCYSLTGELIIPDSVTTIGKQTFWNCTGLTSIVVDSNNTVYDSRENCNCIIKTATNTLIQGCNSSFIPDSVTSIGEYAFTNCYGLTSVVIPDSVITIGGYAFGGCSGLTGELVIPNSVTSIGGYAFSDCRGLTSVVIPDSVISIGNYAFQRCYGLTSVIIGSGCTSIGNQVFRDCSDLTSVIIGSGVTSIGQYVFYNCDGLMEIVCHAITAPTISSNTFRYIKGYGTLFYPAGSDYSNWLSTNNYYLGYYGWTGKTLYTPTECTSLVIIGENVGGRNTTTNISYTATTNGINFDGTILNGVILTGITTSDEFPQNTSETETVERIITFTYLGKTATTTITQGVWENASYTIDLNNQWQTSSIVNPDSTIYDGVYESFSNKGVNNSAAIMYIDIIGCETFKLYIRSNAESNYDYVMVSQLDTTITSGTSYSNTTLVKAHTRGNQQSGTAINNYTLVEFTGIDDGEHRITILYRKDSSAASGTDCGYILIPKNQ